MKENNFKTLSEHEKTSILSWWWPILILFAHY